MSDQLHVRSFSVREFNPKTRTFSGIAVPWETPAEIRDWLGNYTETFQRGAVTAGDKVLVCHRHGEEVGILTSHEDRDEGWWVEGRISETTRGNDTYVLLRDGVLDQLSIGFLPVRHEMDDETGNITRTEVLALEVSVVPFGAYGTDAPVSEVRAAGQATTAPERSTPMETETALAQEVTELRTSMEELGRSFTSFSTREPSAPVDLGDRRSAGEFLQALARGDQDTIDAYNRSQEFLFSEAQHRAYTGGTSADAPIKDAWVGDLTRIFDASSGVLADVFSTGTLPATGNNVEYAELLANTVQVTEQEGEGDDLDFGKVTLTTKTAPVKTYGGYTQLTRQAIERSTLPLLNRSLEALAIAAGARKKAVLRSAFGAAVTAREAVAANGGVVVLGATLAAATAGNWEDALVDAAIKYDAENVGIDALIVSATVFKKLRSLTVAGERVFTVHEKNATGTLNLPGLTGFMAGIPVRLDTGQAGDKAVFVNGRAIRQYDSSLVSLQDENIINLSKDFSVYRYGAVAAEIPQLIVPVKLAAS